MLCPYPSHCHGYFSAAENEPIGYRRLRGVALLTKEYRDAFDKLPAEFRYKDAEKALGKRGRPVTTFLGSLQATGVAEKHGQRKQARYLKVQGAESQSAHSHSPDVAKIIAYCSKYEPDKVYSEDDFRGITGLKGAALTQLIDGLKRQGWLTPSEKCKICYLFVDKTIVGANEDIAPE
jgi:hypothetical protein